MNVSYYIPILDDTTCAMPVDYVEDLKGALSGFFEAIGTRVTLAVAPSQDLYILYLCIYCIAFNQMVL